MIPELQKYSGQVYRVVEAIGRIADALTVKNSKEILAPYGLSVQLWQKYGYRSLVNICEAGQENDEPPEGTDFYDLPTLRAIMKRIEAGELEEILNRE